MKNLIYSIVIFCSILFSCEFDVSKCLDQREYPFMQTIKVDISKDNKSYNHFIMINGCSSESDPLSYAIEKYIDTCKYAPVEQINFLQFKKEGYNEILNLESNSKLYESILFQVHLNKNQKR